MSAKLRLKFDYFALVPHFFATFCRLNHCGNLDFYRVLYDAKEKENDDSVLEMILPNKITREDRF